MDFDKAEGYLVDLLAMPKVSVSKLPTVAKLNADRQTTEPQLYVVIDGCDIAQPDRLNVYSQEETIQGQIFMQARHRDGEFGVFALYEEVCRRMLGHRIPGAATPIILTKFEFVEGGQHDWRYALAFSFTAYRVEHEPPDEEYVFMKKITHNIEVTV